ncbi:DNA-methyltransferase [Streptomyces nigrescens]
MPGPTTPTVAYQTDRVTLYRGDAAELVGLLPTVDLLVTDPPYGVKWDSGRNDGRFGALLGDDGNLDVPRLLGVLARAHLRNRRHAYVFGYRPDQLAEPMQLGGTTQLVWDKGIIGLGNLEHPWGPAHEHITFGVRAKSLSHRRAGDGRLAARIRTGSVLRHQRPNGGQVNRHPTEKPVPLIAELIESSSRHGELVLDPFAGSGSTLVAAVLTGRRAIGCELDERYVEVARRRITEAERIADMMTAA